MVFSLFSRKEKVESKKDSRAVSRADSRAGGGVHSLAAQREAARRTEEQIDRIESEMIAAEAVARAGMSSLPTKPIAADGAPAGANAARGGANAERAGATVEGGTSLVLGDAADAMAIDVNGPALPAILEEAAILYSNGQAQAAALVLRQSLEDPELAGYQPLAWLMLLDLHQCVGDRAGFEAIALQYAARFESSPPGWSDALSPLRTAAAAAAAAPTPTAEGAVPSRVLALAGAIDASIAERAAHFAEAAAVDAEIDCSQAASIDAAGAQALLALLARFERAKSGLAVVGAERLFTVARAAIEPGRRDPSESCWMLALQALRILGRQQEFDDLGIEYCVTYEVSPPSWEPIGETIRVACANAAVAPSAATQSPAPGAALLPAALCETMPQPASARAAAPAAPGSFAAPGGAFVLQGEVLGRMQDELRSLRSFASGRGDVVVDCRSLRRMEFVAAGDLLNEVATMRSAGRQVLFVEPNYLVYALMLVMGIHDLAEIRRRRV